MKTIDYAAADAVSAEAAPARAPQVNEAPSAAVFVQAALESAPRPRILSRRAARWARRAR